QQRQGGGFRNGRGDRTARPCDLLGIVGQQGGGTKLLRGGRVRQQAGSQRVGRLEREGPQRDVRHVRGNIRGGRVREREVDDRGIIRRHGHFGHGRHTDQRHRQREAGRQNAARDGTDNPLHVVEREEVPRRRVHAQTARVQDALRGEGHAVGVEEV